VNDGLQAGISSGRMSQSGTLIAQVRRESNSAALRVQWLHQSPNRRQDANDRLIVRRELSLNAIELTGERLIGFEQFEFAQTIA
jgi:hypothetical protein